MAPFRFSKEDIPLRARFTMIQRQANLCKTEVSSFFSLLFCRTINLERHFTPRYSSARNTGGVSTPLLLSPSILKVLEICTKKKDIPIKFQVRRFHGQTVLKLGEGREEGEKILFLWPIQFPYTEEKERGGVIFEQPRRK